MKVDAFACPTCQGTLILSSEGSLECLGCGGVYPLVDGVPVLLPRHSLSELALRNGNRTITVDQVQAVYDKAYQHAGLMGTDLDRTYDAATKRILLGFAEPLAGKRVLDVGCGIGNLWDYVPPGVEGHALDISLVAAKAAARRYAGLTVSVAASEYLPYPIAYFCCVVAADTLEHTFSPARTVREIRRVLKPGGDLCASFPVPDSLRKWGRNLLVRGRTALPILARLGGVLLRRIALFGRADFQPIDRDKNLEGWTVLLQQAGFHIAQVLEWPQPPEIAIVYLVHAIPDGEIS